MLVGPPKGGPYDDDCFFARSAKTGRRRAVECCRSSGSTRVSPTTLMKFVSPFQRGTQRFAGRAAPHADARRRQQHTHTRHHRLGRAQHHAGRGVEDEMRTLQAMESGGVNRLDRHARGARRDRARDGVAALPRSDDHRRLAGERTYPQGAPRERLALEHRLGLRRQRHRAAGGRVERRCRGERHSDRHLQRQSHRPYGMFDAGCLDHRHRGGHVEVRGKHARSVGRCGHRGGEAVTRPVAGQTPRGVLPGALDVGQREVHAGILEDGAGRPVRSWAGKGSYLLTRPPAHLPPGSSGPDRRRRGGGALSSAAGLPAALASPRPR